MAETRRDVVVIGGSAGSHTALRKILSRLPADLAATVLVAVHLSPHAPSVLASSLQQTSSLPVAAAGDRQRAVQGRVYAAVPGLHLLITKGDLIRLSATPQQNRVRPAVDALFRTAARWCGSRVIAVVLSGSLDDGAAGAASVAQRGGLVIVQDPHDARFSGIPDAALAAVTDACVLPASDIGKAIADAVGQPAVEPAEPPDAGLMWEADMLENGSTKVGVPGSPVALGCPECGGGMYRMVTDRTVHYACHVGHSYSPQTLLAARDRNVEDALWTAISALQERATVLGELAEHAAQAGRESEQRRYHDEAHRAESAAQTLRGQFVGIRPATGDA